MEISAGDEQLRTTLHCDDKEKLRKKLALLQREYLRTAQRLQRAERSEAARRHVRSRITQQNRQDHRDPEISSIPPLSLSSLLPDAHNGTGESECQGAAAGLADSGNTRRSQTIRFTLPSDIACPQTPDPGHDAARGHRPSPALRLRSRRSRLRWERRSAEAGISTDNSDEAWGQSERTDTAKTEESQERVNSGGIEVVNESEELFSGTESESPSLLLTHWNTGQTETGDTEGKELKGQQEQRASQTELRADRKKDSTSLLLTCSNPAVHSEEKGQDGIRKEMEEEESKTSIGERGERLCKDSSNNTTEQNAAETKEIHKNTVEIKEEKRQMAEGEVNGVSLLDSCTLVEGLLFPAEYYVRTTRRMTSSQSQPDMQAVILSQLSVGQRRRSRGRGRGLNRRTPDRQRPDHCSQTDFPSPSAGPGVESQATDTPAELRGQNSGEILDQVSARQLSTDAHSSPVTAVRPARGRKRRRGRGRGRPQTPRCSLRLDTHQPGPDDPQPSSSLLPPTPFLLAADGPKTCLTPGEVVPVPNDPQPAPTHSTATPSSGGDGAPSSSASEHLEKVYPIFLKSSSRTDKPTQMSTGTVSWRSLLLPSTPPSQASVLLLPSLSPAPAVNDLMNFDIPQDFHLPDDQFASLKLHKLRQVTVESGVEHFASPSYNTHRSKRRSETCHSGGSSDPVTPLQLPLSLTPSIANSPDPPEAEQAATQSIKLENMTVEQELTETSASQTTPGEQQMENLDLQCRTHSSSTESVSVVQVCAADCVDQYKERDALILNTHISVSAGNTHRSTERSVKPQLHISSADGAANKGNDSVNGHLDEFQIKESSVVSSEEQTDYCSAVVPLEDPKSTKCQTEDKAIIEALSFEGSLQKTPEEPFNCTARYDSEAPGETPVQLLNIKSPAKESKESSEPTTSPSRENKDECLPHLGVHSQLLLSPPPSSAPSPFVTPRLRSSAPLSSPTLPSLGLTPHAIPVSALPLTSSPSAPALTLPPPHSPSTQALSPPALSPCVSLPPSQPPASPIGQIQTSPEPPDRVEPASLPDVSSIQSQAGSGGQVGPRTEETAEEMKCTHTLEAPAGGFLVDACCLLGSSGGLCVAAAGKWAVCLWSQTAASDWSLIHTWGFNEPVISVFPVPDAAGLVCVTLGQLEIREVRMLSCSGLFQVSLCEGLVQAVVGVSKSRVVTSSHSASGSTLQVFSLSDSDSTPSPRPLVSAGVCVAALAPVDGLPDALIGTDDSGGLFIWNLKTGQLLQRVLLCDGLSHTACLRGYSYCGVLFVLLQHQLLSSLEEEEVEPTLKDHIFLEGEAERKKKALFSLVAVNPLSGKSVQATRLYPPKAWSGRLCEADVSGSSVVGLSQSGCVCVWELRRRGASRMVWAPESEGWQLARFGGGGTLLTGHHNGNVTLHCCSSGQTSLCLGR